jgi:hypothetical protein
MVIKMVNNYKLSGENVEYFKNLIQIASNILFEATLRFEEDGLVVNGIDGANVCGINLKIKKECFDEYEGVCDAPLKIFEFNKIIKKVKQKELFLSINNVLLLKTNKFTKTIPLFDLNPVKVPSLDKKKDLYRLFNIDLKDVNDAIGLLEADSFSLSYCNKLELSDRHELNKMDYYLGSDNIYVGEFSSRFSKEFAIKLLSGIKSDSLQIGLGNNFPLLLFMEGKLEGTLFIAPRMDV